MSVEPQTPVSVSISGSSLIYGDDADNAELGAKVTAIVVGVVNQRGQRTLAAGGVQERAGIQAETIMLAPEGMAAELGEIVAKYKDDIRGVTQLPLDGDPNDNDSGWEDPAPEETGAE